MRSLKTSQKRKRFSCSKYLLCHCHACEQKLTCFIPHPLYRKLLTIENFKEFSAAGEPNWEFIRQTWPYGCQNRALKDIFSRGPTLNAGKKAQYCSPQETIARLGFEPTDVPRVLHVSQVAFHALLATELHEARYQTLPKDIKSFKHYNFGVAMRIFELYPLIYKWRNLTEDFFASLTARFFSDGAPSSAVVDHKDARADHNTFTYSALEAILQQLWKKASSTYLAMRKQHDASNLTQWSDIRRHTVRDDALGAADESAATYWLPEYHVVWGQPRSSIEDYAKVYIHELTACEQQSSKSQ